MAILSSQYIILHKYVELALGTSSLHIRLTLFTEYSYIYTHREYLFCLLYIHMATHHECNSVTSYVTDIESSKRLKNTH